MPTKVKAPTKKVNPVSRITSGVADFARNFAIKSQNALKKPAPTKAPVTTSDRAKLTATAAAPKSSTNPFVNAFQQAKAIAKSSTTPTVKNLTAPLMGNNPLIRGGATGDSTFGKITSGGTAPRMQTQPTPNKLTPVTQTKPTAPATPQTQQTGYNLSTLPKGFNTPTAELINQLYGGQLSSQLGQIQMAKDEALRGLQQQEGVAKEGAYSARNQADVVNAQNRQSQEEQIAALGLAPSGYNLQQIANLNAQRQGALGDINQQLNTNLQNIATERSAAINDANTQSRGLASELSAARNQALLSDLYNSRDFQEQKRQFDVQFQFDKERYGQDFAEQQRQFNINNALEKAAQKEQKRQFNKGFGLDEKQFKEGQRQFDLGYGLDKNQFKEGQRQFNLGFGLDKQQLSLSKQREARIGSGGGSRGGSSSRSSGGGSTSKSANLNDKQFDNVYKDIFDTYAVPVDAGGRDVRRGAGAGYDHMGITSDPVVRKNIFEDVVSLGLSASQTRKMLSKLGIPKGEVDTLLKEYAD